MVNRATQNFFCNKTNSSATLNVGGVCIIISILANRRYSRCVKTVRGLKTSLITPITDFEITKTSVNLNGSIILGQLVTPRVKGVPFLDKKIKWSFLKFKYHGKGYKIKKFNKLSKISFRFGKSHWTKLLYNKKKIIIRRTKKNGYCILRLGNINVYNWKEIIQRVKGVNKYTKRGVRLTRWRLKRRFGKISQASSVYK